MAASELWLMLSCIWCHWFVWLAWISREIWERHVSKRERCRPVTLCTETLMRGREPKELGNEIRCNSIQLLLSRHGWRFKTHPVKIRFTDGEDDRRSRRAAVRYAATTSYSQQQMIYKRTDVIGFRWDLIADSAIMWYRCEKENTTIIWVFTHLSFLLTAALTTQLFQVCAPYLTLGLSSNTAVKAAADTRHHPPALSVIPPPLVLPTVYLSSVCP